jgi:hypothetical protein
MLPFFTCFTCGYDLRGLPLAGKCPECGENISRSLGRERLINANAFWLHQLSLATTMMAIGALPMLASKPIGSEQSIWMTIVIHWPSQPLLYPLAFVQRFIIPEGVGVYLAGSWFLQLVLLTIPFQLRDGNLFAFLLQTRPAWVGLGVVDLIADLATVVVLIHYQRLFRATACAASRINRHAVPTSG